MSINEKKVRTNAVSILQRRYIKNDPERKASLQEERLNAKVAQLIYDIRKEEGLSQKQLADLVGTTQSVISRLEDSDYEGHSFSMLERIARALKKRIKIEVAEDDTAVNPMKYAFQRFMKTVRKNRGLNERQLAEILKVDADYVINLERDISFRPSPLFLQRLSKFLKIPQKRLNALAGATKIINPDFQLHASRFAAQSESFSKLTTEEKRLLDEFINFLRGKSMK